MMAGAATADVTIVADTIVADPDDPLMPMGKPDDDQHAMAMLLRLSGNRHRVWSSTALVYPPGGAGEHVLHGGWTADFWTESAVVEFDELSQDRLFELVSSGSWKGKAGAYDMAGNAAPDTRLIEGEEITVLGLAPGAIAALESD
jgi:septum formation protein